MREMMSDEDAKALADAMNRLSAALEAVTRGGLYGGIQVHHHGIPNQQLQFGLGATTFVNPYDQSPGGNC